VVAEQEINSKADSDIITTHGLGSGRISYSDFLIATVDWKILIDNESVWGAFCSFDKDRDGKISIQDIRKALKRVGCEVTDEDFELLTLDYNRTTTAEIDFEEFKNLLLMFNEANSDDTCPLLIRKRTFNPEIAMSRATSYDPMSRLEPSNYSVFNPSDGVETRMRLDVPKSENFGGVIESALRPMPTKRGTELAKLVT
jgi:hypothetical protein